MIHYVELPPTSFLAPYVECIWTLKSHSHFFKKRELIIPGGRVEMMFNFGDPTDWIDSKDLSVCRSYSGAFLLGPRNRPFFVEQRGNINMIGVRFRHGGLMPFTIVPMRMMMNAVVPQDRIFGKDVDALTDRLYESIDTRHVVTLIEDFLSKRFGAQTDARQTLQLISLVKGCDNEASFKSLSDRTGVHYKKLERVFAQSTGYNPKNFTRVIRFYKACQEMKKSSSSLTGIGLSKGYYDQPHFIHDFKSFTGKSPRQFHAENPTIANLLLQSKHV